MRRGIHVSASKMCWYSASWAFGHHLRFLMFLASSLHKLFAILHVFAYGVFFIANYYWSWQCFGGWEQTPLKLECRQKTCGTRTRKWANLDSNTKTAAYITKRCDPILSRTTIHQSRPAYFFQNNWNIDNLGQVNIMKMQRWNTYRKQMKRTHETEPLFSHLNLNRIYIPRYVRLYRFYKLTYFTRIIFDDNSCLRMPDGESMIYRKSCFLCINK